MKRIQERTETGLGCQLLRRRGQPAWARSRCPYGWLLAGLVGMQAAHGGTYPNGSGSQIFGYTDGTTEFADGTQLGTDDPVGGAGVIGVYDQRLRLVERNTKSSVSSFKLPDLDPGNVVRSLDLRVSVVLQAPTEGVAGEGWSINFGRLPGDNGTGEGGFAPLPRGLTVAFSTRENPDDPPAITIRVGGVSVAEFPQALPSDGTERALVLGWDAGGLDLVYAGRAICTDLALPGFAPGVGDRFGFTARTSATASQGVLLDSLRVTTQALPVIETGGPVISEFVADNDEVEDEFADKPDWIEILNGSATSVDLAGWYLTDSKADLTKWKIGRLPMTPYGYQVVFASGRDRQYASNALPHASFTLDRDGGYVALVRPDGKTVASAYEYGAQDRNVAYGEKGSERKRGYLFPATPGRVNTSEPEPGPRAPDVRFSHPGGLVPGPLGVVLSVPGAPAAEIRYTTNRTEPGPTSLRYTGPLTLTNVVMVRARAYLPGRLPGPIASRTYVRMDGTLTNYAGTGQVFESNLPLLYLESFGTSVDSSSGGTVPFRPCYAVVIPPDPATGRARLTGTPEYAGPAGVHVRGESSSGFEQKSYALELWDEASRDFDAPLLGMPADSDWVLYGPWSEKTLMRNKLVFDWMRALRGPDGTAVRTRFVELFFNQTRSATGQVGYPSYRGIYVLMEKMKRGGDRVPLANLNTNTYDPELITGGYIFRKDKVDTQKNNWTTSRFGIALQSFDPDRLNTNQLTYLRGYINTMETALNGAGYRNTTNGYRAYLDPDTFIDAQWMLEIAKQVDGYVFSTYWHKDRAGRIRAGPLWDFNISLGNADYATGDTPTGWLYDTANGVGQNWYPRLHTDPDYRLAHWDRYWHLRRTILATDTVLAEIDRHQTNLLDGYALPVTNRMPASVRNPVARHFTRWPRLGQRDWPNPAAATRLRTWQSEVDYLKSWLRTRLEWLDDQSLRSGRTIFRPPVLSRDGGRLEAPIDLTITPYQRANPTNTYPVGTVYYTLDGSDPRLLGGAISPFATAFSAPLRIRSSVTVRARLLQGANWSPEATATYRMDVVPAGPGNLVISEILHRPAPLTPAEIAAGVVDASAFEFLELRNIGDRAIDLAGVRFTSGFEFDFTFAAERGRLLAPGDSAVLVADARAFRLRNPGVPEGRLAGQFRGSLDSGGETVVVRAADGAIIQELRYDDDPPWPATDTPPGRSLVLLRPATQLQPGHAASWVASAVVGGTPGTFGTGATVFAGHPSDDVDGDGLSDLYEFAAGSDPEHAGSAFGPVASIDGETLRFEVRRRPGLSAVRLGVEASLDLRTWNPGDAHFVVETTRVNSDGTVTDVHRGRLGLGAIPGAAMFVRVVASVVPGDQP